MRMCRVSVSMKLKRRRCKLVESQVGLIQVKGSLNKQQPVTDEMCEALSVISPSCLLLHQHACTVEFSGGMGEMSCLM